MNNSRIFKLSSISKVVILVLVVSAVILFPWASVVMLKFPLELFNIVIFLQVLTIPIWSTYFWKAAGKYIVVTNEGIAIQRLALPFSRPLHFTWGQIHGFERVSVRNMLTGGSASNIHQPFAILTDRGKISVATLDKETFILLAIIKNRGTNLNPEPLENAAIGANESYFK